MNKQIRNIYLNYHHTYPLSQNIRFELGYGSEENYMINAKKRATKIFNDVFQKDDPIQLIFFVSKYSRKTRINRFLFRNDYKIIDSFETSAFNDYYDEPIMVLIVETKINNLKILKTIDALCYQDFPTPVKLKIPSILVFYNPKTNTILNVYDDRGCDLWSDNEFSQKKMYHKYNNWVLH